MLTGVGVHDKVKKNISKCRFYTYSFLILP